MRLLKIEAGGDFSLVERSGSDIPPYAILSHTWGKDEDEVTFKDWNNGTGKTKVGYNKIRSCGEQAAKEGLEYFWIDTLCIDKSSSAELSKAINSMYLWYQAADVCYAFLDDVPSQKTFLDSRWFTRGWTLQELVAPTNVVFFDEGWITLGNRTDLQEDISKCTRIPTTLLSGSDDLEDFSVAQRMSWASQRQTKRIEDRAYCMLGIFDINMPLIYGEGENAFLRLQEEIIKISDDHSIFAWRSTDDRCGCLATSPDSFATSSNIVQHNFSDTVNEPSVSGIGIYLEVPFMADACGERQGFAVLNCCERGNEKTAIALRVKDLGLTMKRFERIYSNELKPMHLPSITKSYYPVRRIRIQKGRIGRVQKTKGSPEPSIVPPQENEEFWCLKDPVTNELCGNFLRAVENGPECGVWWHLAIADTNVNAVDDLGLSALSHAARRGDERIMNMLLGREGVDVDSYDSHGLTPLAWAAVAGHEAIVKMLFETYRAQVDIKSESGRTPLSLAAEIGHVSIVNLLLDTEKVDVDSVSENGQTPLSWAASNGQEMVIQALFDWDDEEVNVNSKDVNGLTPLSLAAQNGHEAVVEVLLQTGRAELGSNEHGKTALFLAAENGHASIVKLLLDTGKVDIEDELNPRPQPILTAAMNGHEEVVELLLEAGKDGSENHAQSLLLWATEKGNEAMAALALGTGRVNVNLPDREGITPISRAIKNGNETAVKLLLEQIRLVEVNPKSGHKTPLFYAAASGREEVVKLNTG